MKYSEIIEEKVKQLLEKNNISFSDFELDNCSVNIRDFIEKYTDFTIEEEPLYKKSSKLDKEENKIIVNILEDEERKRFYMAYELGYTLLETKTTSENSDEVAILVHELLAKEFAYSFLMPEKLNVPMKLLQYKMNETENIWR